MNDIPDQNDNNQLNKDAVFGYHHSKGVSSFSQNKITKSSKKINMIFGLLVLVLFVVGGGVALYLVHQSGSGDTRQRASEDRARLQINLSGIEDESDGEPEYVPNLVLVKTNQAEPAFTTLSRATSRLASNNITVNEEASITSFSSLENVGVISLDAQEDQDLDETIRLLEDDPSIEYAEPVYLAKYFVANDAYYKSATKNGLDYYQWNLARINIEDAWSLLPTRGDSSVVVAIIDSGVAFKNYVDTQTGMVYEKASELANINFVSPASFQSLNCNYEPLEATIVSQDAGDYYGHGTHIAGTIAQATNNSQHAAGIASETSIMPIRIGHPCPLGGTYEQVISSYDIALGIRHAADNGAKVINLSLGLSGNAQVIREAIEYAYNKGVVLVAATGNDAKSSKAISYPAAYPQTIAIGATRWDNQRAVYSQYLVNSRVGVDLMAPGGQLIDDAGEMVLDQNDDKLFDGIVQQTILSNEPSTFTEVGNYIQINTDVGFYCLVEEGGSINLAVDECGLFQGTSMATPHVVGVVAMMLAADPSLSPAQVKTILQDTAQWYPEFNTLEYGAGLVDAGAAVAAVLDGNPPDPSLTPDPTITPDPSLTPDPTITPDPDPDCSSASDCNDDNECTVDVCLSPGTADALCQYQMLEGNICNSGAGICSEIGQCLDLEDATVISLQVALDGIPYCEGDICHHPQTAGREVSLQVTFMNSIDGSTVRPVPVIYDETQKIYKTKQLQPLVLRTLTPGPYIAVLKGPMHLGTRYCYYDQKAGENCSLQDLVDATSSMTAAMAADAKFIWLEPGQAYSLDFSLSAVKVGDLPISDPNSSSQDGKVNVRDYSFMLSCLGNNSRSEACLARADVDFSGQVNNIDLGLLRKTLVEVADQV